MSEFPYILTCFLLFLLLSENPDMGVNDNAKIVPVLIKHHATKTYRGVETELQAFLSLGAQEVY
jgi:hypothetical protein